MLVGATLLAGCASRAPGPEYALFERGVVSARKLTEAHHAYRRDGLQQAADAALVTSADGAPARLDVSDGCFDGARELQRRVACAASWSAWHAGGEAGAAPDCPAPDGVLQVLSPAACELGRVTDDGGDVLVVPLPVPAVPLDVARDLAEALAEYASELEALASARDINGIDAATTRIERTLGGLATEVTRLTDARRTRAAGPATAFVLSSGSLFLEARRQAALRAALTQADAPVRDAAVALSYLLAPAYVDRLDELGEALDTALDATRAASSDPDRFQRAVARARRAHSRYVALRNAPPGAALQAMVDAHDALRVAVTSAGIAPDDALDRARVLLRRAERALDAFVEN